MVRRAAAIKIKRAYDPPEKSDGYRVLVDRLWPRGIKKEDLPLDEWAKEIAPSTALRKTFSHDPEKWTDFQRAYKAELRKSEAKTKIAELAEKARKGPLTLVYSAKDPDHNNAQVLKDVIRSAARP